MQGSTLLLVVMLSALSGCLAQDNGTVPVTTGLPSQLPPQPLTTTTGSVATTLASFPALTTLRPDEVAPEEVVATDPPAPATTVVDDSSCSTVVQCIASRGQLSVCINATCICGAKAYEKDGACLPKKYLKESCLTSEECQHIEHAVCTSSVCSCDVGYTSENNVCNVAIPPPTPPAVPMNRDISGGITITPNYDPEGTFKVLKVKSPELVLECTVSGASVNYSVSWLKNRTALPKDERFKTVQPNKLTIKEPVQEDADTYTCIFSFLNNATGSRDADITVIVPLFVRLPASTSAVEGEKLQLKCTVYGRPVPSITWQFGNNTLKEEKGRYQLLELEEVPNAMLQIDDVKMDDRGEYTCTARNGFSNETSATTMVRVKDKLAALWPFLGICAEVFVLCAIILIYEKKRNKTELEESDTDQSPEQKNTPDHGKDSVRQRK